MIYFATETWPYVIAIILVALAASYASKGFGVALCILICILSVFLTIILALGGSGRYFFTMLVIYPISSWAGFWLGRVLQKRKAGQLPHETDKNGR